MTKNTSHVVIKNAELSLPLRLFRYVIHRYGLFGVITIGTMMSILLSVSATAITTFLIDGEVSGLYISTFVGAAVGFIMTFIMVLVLRDLERMHEQLEYIARTDSLTQAFNRRYFMDMLAYELEKSMRYGDPLTLILFDIDNFKSVNDRYGHNAGDAVLQSISQLCSNETRQPDIFARVGGEEFACLLSGPSANNYTILAERLRQEVQNHVTTYEQHVIQVTISLGVASYQAGMTLPGHLLKQADIALYRAKEQGKNRVEKHSIQEPEAYISPARAELY